MQNAKKTHGKKLVTIHNPEGKVFFSSRFTQRLPIPQYSLVNGEEIFPVWLSRKESVENAKRYICASKTDVYRLAPASDDFKSYYLKVYAFEENRRHRGTSKYDESLEMQYRHNTDAYFPYISGGMVCACPDCGSVVKGKVDMDVATEDVLAVLNKYGQEDGLAVLDNEGMLSSNIMYFECPKCGKRLELKDSTDISNRSMQAKTMTLFEDEGKLIVSGFINTFYINAKAKNIGMDAIRPRIVFNTKTGQSYILPTMNLKGRKTKHCVQHITNCTFTGCYNYSTPLSELLGVGEFRDAIIKELTRLHEQPNRAEELIEVAGSRSLKTAMTIITVYNRFPMLDTDNILRLVDAIEKNDISKKISSVMHSIKTNTSQTEIISLLDVNFAKTKTFKRLVAQDILNAFKLKTFYEYGFRKVDLMERFCLIENRAIAFNKSSDFDERAAMKGNREFVRRLIKERGDVNALRLLMADSSFFADTARMYTQLKNHDVISHNDFKGTLREIHDKFSRLMDKVRYENVVIKYSDSEINKYNQTISNIEFKLAKDTHELIRVGQSMGICVGGYGENAVARSCTIVVAYEDEKPVICIELHSSRLIQAKCKYNNLAQGHLALALKNWVETTGVDAENCCDFIHIAKGEIELDESKAYMSKTDFHALEIDEDGNVYNGYHANNHYMPANLDDEELEF